MTRCASCRRPVLTAEGRLCPTCRASKARSRRRPSALAADRQRATRLRTLRKAARLCVACGQPAAPNRVACSACLLRDKARVAARPETSR